MGNEERRDDYLAKAKQAEDQAGKAADEATKASWLQIAAGYRDQAGRQNNPSR